MMSTHKRLAIITINTNEYSILQMPKKEQLTDGMLTLLVCSINGKFAKQ